MKRLKALGVALILWLICVVGIHYIGIASLPKENRDFGYWINFTKDASYEALSKNITDKSVLCLGSSELHHGQGDKFTPSNLFRMTDNDVMFIGSAYNQCLTHAIVAGSIGPRLKNKKVVLLLSPTWFYSHDANRQTKFYLRYSDVEYRELMKNKNLSRETKAKIKEKVDGFLGEADKSPFGVLAKRIRKNLQEEKDCTRCAITWNFSGKQIAKKRNAKYIRQPNAELDFDELRKDALQATKGQCSNKYNMQDKFYKTKIKPYLRQRKDCNNKRSFKTSVEYEELQIFLDVCKEQGIEVLLVLQPLNGRWYDYTGFPAEKRKVGYANIRKIAKDNNVKLSDLSGEEYTKNFFEDTVHPSEKGWVKIDEAIYKFFEK